MGQIRVRLEVSDALFNEYILEQGVQLTWYVPAG
jgi:hypothetical protein